MIDPLPPTLPVEPTALFRTVAVVIAGLLAWVGYTIVRLPERKRAILPVAEDEPEAPPKLDEAPAATSDDAAAKPDDAEPDDVAAAKPDDAKPDDAKPDDAKPDDSAAKPDAPKSDPPKAD